MVVVGDRAYELQINSEGILFRLTSYSYGYGYSYRDRTGKLFTQKLRQLIFKFIRLGTPMHLSVSSIKKHFVSPTPTKA